ncbi:DUF192 domain-containing protein [Methylophilus sp.]|uniref:DUF192 domain-containing protein n=1 Tax=Methylophilus sp. TaxID=29541 RepID=UPI000D424D2A|nr:DUF192 domain-containing protein [Methylophilus sp.]PPD13263.1 MAG: hypothetical protein CTY26_00135 [Methylophilus sp.]
MKVMILHSQRTIVSTLNVAEGYFSRLRGLMFRKALNSGEGLLIKPCKQIHTHFMRFPIDAIFMDHKNVVIHIEHGLRPWKITPFYKQALSVLEVNQGCAVDINLGDTLEIVK